MEPPKFDLYKVLREIKSDSSLDAEEKEELLKKAKSPGFIDSLMYGAGGASLAYMISQYLSLSPIAKTLLSAAGFGIGTLLLRRMHQENIDAQFGMKWNEKIKAYQMM